MSDPGYYYLSPDQTPVGPQDAAVLTALRAQGVVTPETLICRPGDVSWRPFSDWPELRGREGEPLLPPETAPPSAEGIYGNKSWVRWFATVGGLFLVGLIAWGGTLPLRLHRGDLPTLALAWMLLFVGLGTVGLLLGIVDAWVGRVIVEPDRISRKSLFGLRSLPFEGIAGIRILIVKNSKYLLFIPKDSAAKKLKISQSFEGWERIAAWAGHRFGNLDQLEAAEITRTILADDNLGGTPESRARRLALAKTWGRVGYGVAIGLMLWGMILPQPYRLLVLLLGLAALLLPAALFIAFRGYVAFDGKKSDPRPKLIPLALLPLAALGFRALVDFHLLAPFWMFGVPCLGAGIVATLLLRPLLIEKRIAVLFFWALFVSLLFYGPLVESNCLLDRSPAMRNATRVISTYITHGSKGGVHYHIRVIGWANHPAEEVFEVHRNFYLLVHPQDSILVVTHQGAWGLPWAYLHLASPPERTFGNPPPSFNPAPASAAST